MRKESRILENCAYHPDREAVGACINCGKLICDECKVILKGKIYCSPCMNDIYLGKTAAKTSGLKAAASKVVSTEIPKLRKDFLTYVDDAVGFSISYPGTWNVEADSSDYVVCFVAPEAKHGGTANCVVVHEKAPAQESLQSYFARSKADLQKGFKEYNPISEEELIIDDIPAMEHIFTYSDKNMIFKLTQIYLKQGEVGWVLCCASVPDAFDSYLTTFKAITASFHLFGSSRGNTATFIPSKGVMKGDIRGWGIALIIMGIIQIFVPFLDPVWGGLLIAVGVLELFVQHRALFIVNGIVMIIAGIINLVAAIEYEAGIGALAIIQFIWGVNEIRKFSKYR